jgi:signal transduction histidine kinase
MLPVLLYLLLTFPDGRLRPGVDRSLFGAIMGLIVLLYIGSALFVEAYPTQTPWTTCTTDCPPNAFLVLDSEPAVMDAVVAPFRELVAVVVLAGVTRSLLARFAAARSLRRRVLGPVVLMGMASTVTLAVYLVTRRAAPDSDAVVTLGKLWSLSIPGVAAGFLVGLVRRRMLVGDVLTNLSVALSRRLDRRELRDTLATALDDPELAVLVPDDVHGRWRDTEGRITSRPEAAADGRRVLSIDGDDGPVAALVHDSELEEEDDLLGPVRALIVATLHHERVMSRLAASVEALEDSRKRISRSADLERKRIERDLHDGAQQRLVGLRIRLALAEGLALEDPEAGVAAMHELGTEVELALEELRSLAHGVYPSLLTDRGLEDALRSVVLDCPIPVRLTAHGLTRQPAEVETAVYFACLEAIQNAVKHARRASGLWVSLRQDRQLLFEVRDDGPGFEPPSGALSGGLRNMRDRVEAIGGRLTIESAPGHGTSIRGVVPLD